MPDKKDTDASDVQDNLEQADKDSDQNASRDAQLKSETDIENKKEKDESEPVDDKGDKKDREVEIEAAEEKKPEGEEEVEKKPPAQKTDWDGDLNHYAETRKDLPTIKSGDLIRVSYRVIEGGKERIQVFEGVVIALKNMGVSRTITVRKTSFGIAVERVFPLNSTLVQKIEVKKHSKVRRAKLYYLRKLRGKAARLKELR